MFFHISPELSLTLVALLSLPCVGFSVYGAINLFRKAKKMVLDSLEKSLLIEQRVPLKLPTPIPLSPSNKKELFEPFIKTMVHLLIKFKSIEPVGETTKEIESILKRVVPENTYHKNLNLFSFELKNEINLFLRYDDKLHLASAIYGLPNGSIVEKMEVNTSNAPILLEQGVLIEGLTKVNALLTEPALHDESIIQGLKENIHTLYTRIKHEEEMEHAANIKEIKEILQSTSSKNITHQQIDLTGNSFKDFELDELEKEVLRLK